MDAGHQTVRTVKRQEPAELWLQGHGFSHPVQRMLCWDSRRSLVSNQFEVLQRESRRGLPSANKREGFHVTLQKLKTSATAQPRRQDKNKAGPTASNAIEIKDVDYCWTHLIPNIYSLYPNSTVALLSSTVLWIGAARNGNLSVKVRQRWTRIRCEDKPSSISLA